MPGSRKFELYSLYRIQVLGTFAIVAAVAVWMVSMAATGTEQGPPLPFVAFWILAALWNGYWFLFRVSYRLVMDEGWPRWDAPVRHGAIALATLVEVVPSKFGSSLAVIRVAHGRGVLVRRSKGLRDFVLAMQVEAPQLVIQENWYARIVERLPGRGGFRQ